MLGQLLGSLSSSSFSRRQSSRHPGPVDPLSQEFHTQELLFPSSSLSLPHVGTLDQSAAGPPLISSDTAAQVSRSSVACGDLPGHEPLDFELPRDVRILIAQAGHVNTQPDLLYDSRPAPVVESCKSPTMRPLRNSSRNESTTGSHTGSTRVRSSNAGVHPIPEDSHQHHPHSHHHHSHHPSHHRRTGSAFSTSGAIERARMRRSSMSSTHSLMFDPIQEAGWERDDVEKIALGCMFENASSSYKGTSNKVHVIPLSSKPHDNPCLSQSLDSDSGFSTRSQLTRKPSSLSQSHVPGNSMAGLNTAMAFREQPPSPAGQSHRRTVLVTRTFSITWQDDESFDDQKTVGATTRARPPPTSPRDRHFSRQRASRSPMYAVTIVLHLPIATVPSASTTADSSSISRASTLGRKTLRQDSISQQSHLSFGSSPESDRRPFGPSDPFMHDSCASLAISSDVDDRVDLIGKHWDIIARTMTTLQILAQKKILELLEPMGRNTRHLKLPAQALYHDADINKGAELCSIRIVRGMKIPRVKTGKVQWSVWRAEARWLANWAGGREENMFFFILLTAFLGTHTDWLVGLAPKWYRRRFQEQQRMLGQTSKLSIPSRTVIISPDKMAARRLIFLLATFLPANHASFGDVSPLRPSTSASYRAYSQSPPGYFPVPRQSSLRRAINSRVRSGASRQEALEPTTPTTLVESRDDWTDSASGPGSDPVPGHGTEQDTGTVASRPQNHDDDKQPRESVTARSIKSKFAGIDVDPSERKCPATASSIGAGTVVVKPHFAKQPCHGPNKPPHSRGSSTTSVTLIPLQQVSSNESQCSRNWSFRNMWSARRDSASDLSDVLQTTDEGLGIVGIPPAPSSSKLQQMVDEIHHTAQDSPFRKSTEGHYVVFASPELRERSPERLKLAGSSQPIQIPVKMSINKEDGVIDVELPCGDLGSPTILSPGLSVGYHSSSSFGATSSGGLTSTLLMSPAEPEHSHNVGGWLDKLHPDFTLQAVKPYASALEDVKAAMSAEPTPPLTESLPDNVTSVEKWLNMCTTIVADTANYTVNRISLRRLVRYIGTVAPQTPLAPGSMGFPARSQYGNPYREPALVGPAGIAVPVTEHIIKEEFIEETVRNIDRDFIDVVERVIGTPAWSQKCQEKSSSQASSIRGRPSSVEDGGGPGDNVQDCQKLIIGCLEAIVLAETQVQTKASVSTCGNHKEHVSTNHESTLRHGVRKWLRDIEAKAAAATETSKPATIHKDTTRFSSNISETLSLPIRSTEPTPKSFPTMFDSRPPELKTAPMPTPSQS